MKNKWFLIIFVLVFLVGTFLRFYQLGAIPASMDWDEVSWGYNAYSILLTGKDEYGKHLPMSFQAFGDYKQPVYVYLDTIPLALFGLTAYATRFPSAFLGSLSILLVFFLTYELFLKYKEAKIVALLSMLFFAISPWSIQFSRLAFEANVGLFFILLGTWLFIRGLNLKQTWYFFVGTFFLALSAYTYHSDKLFAPFLFIVLILYGWKYFVTKKNLIIGLVLLFCFCNIFWVIDSRTTARGRGVLFTSNTTTLLATPINELQYDKEQGDIIGEIVHNRRVVYIQEYIINYLDHFNPNWLYMTGDNSRHHTPGIGNLYLANLPFLLLGIFYLLRYRASASWILFFWMLAAPAASALAVDAPNADRSLIFLPTWQIFEAFGWWWAVSLVKDKKMRLLFLLPIFLLIINVVYYLHQYFVHTNTDVQKDWQYGYKEAALFADQYRNSGNRVVFDKSFEQPYIFYLFYNKYDPSQYIVSGGSYRTSKACFTINHVYFGDCLNQIRTGDIYVALGSDSIGKGNVLKKVLYSTGDPAVTMYQQ